MAKVFRSLYKFGRIAQPHAFHVSSLRPCALNVARSGIRYYTTEQSNPEKNGKENIDNEPNAEAESSRTESQPQKELSFEELNVELSKLKEEHAKAEEEIKSLKNKLAYALADIDNVRKISRKDVSNAREFALKDFGKDLLDVVDNCERALAIFPEECKVKGHAMAGIYVGLEMTANVMMKVFEKHGVVRIPIEPKQTVFDPNFHDALFQQPVAGLSAGLIFAVVKSGWTINGRVLRAAQVGVSADPPEEEEAPKEAAPQ